MMRREFDAGGQSATPNQAAVAPRFAHAGKQQDEAFRQLALLREHDTRAGLRNIGDRAAARQRLAIDQNAGIVMELPARLSAQFGSVAGVTDSDPQKRSMPQNLLAAQL